MLGTKELREEYSKIYKIHNAICPTDLKKPGQIRVYREFIEEAIKEKLIKEGVTQSSFDKGSIYLFYGKNKLEDDLMGCIINSIEEKTSTTKKDVKKTIDESGFAEKLDEIDVHKCKFDNGDGCPDDGHICEYDKE